MNELLKRCVGWSPGGLKPHYTNRSNFVKESRSKDGLYSICRKCSTIRHAHSNPKRVKSGNVNKEGKYYSERSIRYQHKKKGLAYDISVTRELVYLYALGICHICHKYVPYESKWVMEHRDGDKGWTWDNMRVAHCHCNNRKGSSKMYELEIRGILAEMRNPVYTEMSRKAIGSA